MYDPGNFINADEQTQVFKDKLTHQKVSKYIGNEKFLNSNLTFSGVSRFTEETVDRFTMTRTANHPELVFNCDNHKD